MNKRLIRLTESDLHKIIKESVNKILNEVSADKAYWLMQQRKQNPNTKSKTQMHYPGEFASRFNKEVYGDVNGGNIDANGQAMGNAKVDNYGNFIANQSTGWGASSNGANFNYRQGLNQNQETDGFYNQGGQKMNPSQVNMHPQVKNFINRGRTRYNQIQQNYNQNQQGN